MKSRPSAILLLTSLAISMAAPGHAGTRAWTNAQGRQIQAEFGGVKDGQVTLIMAGGQSAVVALTGLSAADQEWVRQNASSAVAATTPADPADAARVPWEKRRMPTEVREPTLYMNIKVVKETPEECIYESGHFQFKTSARLGQALMKDVCRAFESTYELVRLMPWGIVPRPEEGRTKFQAELYATRGQFLATGAPPWSAGVYVRKDKVFRMPFSELGISDTPGPAGYYRKGAINNDTITHEITHQMMHEYLPYMPVWLIEGLAEYTSNMEYKSGVFSVAEDSAAFLAKKPGSRNRGLFAAMNQQRFNWLGVQEMWGFTTDITERNPIDIVTLTERRRNEAGNRVTYQPPSRPPEMSALGARYRSSHILAWFFIHDEGGQRLMRYFDAVHEEKKKWPAFWKQVDAYNAAIDKLKPAYEAYRTEMKTFMSQPGVKDLGNGRFSYPDNLTPPKPPAKGPEEPEPPEDTDPEAVCAKHLGILLGGRSLEKLEADVRAMFQKSGLAL